MGDPSSSADDRSSVECATTDSFADHGIDDGSTLIHQTHYRLQDADITAFTATESFFDSLESAFIWAYLAAAEEHGVPDHVAWAIDDARALTAAKYQADDDPDLRTDVIPTFYSHVAGFHCAYRA